VVLNGGRQAGPPWEARAIGEDGLPAKEWQRPHMLVCKLCDLKACKAVADAIEERHQIRLEAASHKCCICGDIATNWVELACHSLWYYCDRHEAYGQNALHDWSAYWKKQTPSAVGTEAKPESHPCAMCGEPAKEYVDVHIRGWMCEQHSHVSVGCLSEKEKP